MKKKVSVVIAVVVILIAIGLLISNLGSPRSQRISDAYTLTLVDIQANKIFEKEVSMDERLKLPAESPFSSGNNAYLVYQCTRDGTIFAFQEQQVDEEEPVVQKFPRCPVCGSLEHLTSPELPEGMESMDVPGPVTVVR